MPMLPLRDDNPTQHRPVVTWLIIGLCVVAYFFWQPTPFEDTNEDAVFTYEHAAIPCEVIHGRPLSIAELPQNNAGDTEACGVGLSRPAVFPGKLIYPSVLISVFLHGSLIHLAGNMLFLWVFGNNVEDRLGKLAFALFYLGGGIVAALGHIAVNSSSTVPVIGASGAIAAVMGAYLVWYPNARVLTLVFIVIVRLRAMWVLLAWFVLQFFTNPNTGVAWIAHVTGFVYGVIVALLVSALTGGYRSRPTPQQRYYY
jgi:membrane associated rhomboid family serine protease